MPRFLSDMPHEIYRRRAFAIAAIVTGLFLLLFASLPVLFRSDPFLSSRTPAYEEVSTEVFENLVHAGIRFAVVVPLLRPHDAHPDYVPAVRL